MDNEMEELEVEIHKIIIAPVAVSLKKLHNILVDNDEQYESMICRWTFEHGDQVSSLASTVVHALSHQPYVLEIIERLSCVKVLRDAILEASPTLLRQILDKAIESDDAFEQYSKLCLVLLQEPLEPYVGLPRSAETLLSIFFGKVEQKPCLTTAYPIYTLLDGACESLLGILPQDGLDTFQEHLIKIMRSANSVDMNEQLLHIVCLAITSKLIRSCPNFVSNRPANDVRKLFFGDKASTTIHLVTLQVIYACRSESLPEIERLKRVKLARQILEVVDVESRLNWVKTNPKIDRKLQERLVNSNLPTVVQTEAFAFFALISPEDRNVPANLIHAYQEALLKLCSTACYNIRLSNAVSISTPCFARHLQHDFWENFMRIYIERANETNRKSELSSEYLLGTLKNLEDACMHCSVTRKHLIEAATSTKIFRQLEDFLSQREVNLEVASVLCASMSRIGTASSQDETPFPSTLLLKMITKLQQCNQTHLEQRDTRERDKKSGKPGLVLQAEVSEEHGVSHQWRERLAFDLESEGKSRQDSIIRFVGQICRDFEERCENVEKPLRETTMERDELESELHCVEARAKEAEEEAGMLKRQISTLQAAYNQLENAQNDARAHITNLNTKYQGLEEVHQQSKLHAEQTLATAHDDFETRRLELKTIITGQLEELDGKSKDVANLNHHVASLESEIEDGKARNQELETSLHAAYASLTASEASAKSLAQENENLIDSSRRREDDLKSKIRSLEGENQELCNRMGRAGEEHRATVQAQQNTLKRIQEDHDTETKKIEVKTAMNYNTLDKILQDTKEELGRTQEAHQVERQRQVKELRSLQRELERYANDCKEKEKQLRNAQMMKSRLLTAMGLEGDSLSLGEEAGRDASEERVIPQAETRRLKNPVRFPSTPGTPTTQDEDGSLGHDSNQETEQQSTRGRSKPQKASYQAGPTTREFPRGGLQSLVHGRGQHSMDSQRLGTASANRLNQQKPLFPSKSSHNRRKTEDTNLYAGSVKDQLFGSDAGAVDTITEQVSDEAAAGADVENVGISSASEYFDGLGTEDFDGTTVEL